MPAATGAALRKSRRPTLIMPRSIGAWHLRCQPPWVPATRTVTFSRMPTLYTGVVPMTNGPSPAIPWENVDQTDEEVVRQVLAGNTAVSYTHLTLPTSDL